MHRTLGNDRFQKTGRLTMIGLEDRIEKLILEEFKDELGTYDGRTNGLAHEIMNLIRSLPKAELDAELAGR
jgi:hypothetical protein